MWNIIIVLHEISSPKKNLGCQETQYKAQWKSTATHKYVIHYVFYAVLKKHLE